MPAPLRLLLIEDSEDDALLIIRELRRGGYEPVTERVDTAPALLAALVRETWDVVTCDWVMPELTAPAALQLLSQQSVDAPIIIVSGEVGEEFAVTAMKAGASDFVSKHRLARLCPAVERELREAEDRRARRHAETALRASDARYQDLVENANDIIYTHDFEGTFTSINRAAELISGYRREEIIGRNVAEFVAPESLHVARQARDPGLSPDLPVTSEIEIIARDGHRVSLEVSSRLYFQNAEIHAGVPIGMQGVARDITQRKRAEGAVRLLRILIDQSNDAIEIIDPETGRFLDINEKGYLELGYTREEFLTLSVFDIDPMVDQSVFARNMEKVRESGVLMWEGIHRRKDGSTFPVEVNIRHVRFDRDYVITVVRDLTERKRAEAALLATTDQLAAVAKAMTEFLEHGDWRSTSAVILRTAIAQTGSEYGFIGTVVEGPVLRILAHEGIVWDEVVGRELYDSAVRTYGDVGYLEFSNVATLFGRVITTGETVIANDAPRDPRSGGLPPGHPPLRHFLGVPILANTGQVVSMIGLANRPGGYTGAETEGIEILAHAAAVLYESYQRAERLKAATAERQRAAEALRGSEQRFRALLDNASDLISILDPDGTARYISPSHEAILGYAPEDFVGKNAFDFIHPEDLARLLKLARRSILQTGRTEAIEFRFRHANGSWRVLEGTGRNLLDEPSIAGFVVNSRDITERKRADEGRKLAFADLQRSEELSSNLFESAPDATLVVDEAGVIVRVNALAEKMFGWGRDELLGRPLEQLLPARLGERHAEHRAEYVGHAAQRPMGAGLDLWARRQDGGEFPTDVALSPLHMSGRTLVLATIRDITESKRAAAQLKLDVAEQMAVNQLGQVALSGAEISVVLQEALRHVRQAIEVDCCMVLKVVADGETFLQYGPDSLATPGPQTTFPVSPDLPCGYTLRSRQPLIVEDLRTDTRFQVAPFMREAGIISGMTVLIGHLDPPVGVFCAYSTTRREFGPGDVHFLQSVANVIGLAVERKRAEEHLQSLNAVLDQRVSERTTQLEVVNRELESFSASVAHDLRAPLRGIEGFSRALLEDSRAQLDADGRACLARIGGNVQRMNTLIDDLLRLARVTTAEMQPVAVDLSALARAVAAELQQREPGRAVTFAIEDGITAYGDRALLRVVLDNLIGNAWKYTGRRAAARIAVGVEEQDGNPAYCVRDDGAGFDMAYADKLFGAFQRLHDQDEFEGTGIGLATVQRIIHRHGGRVWAEAAVDQGATFYFVLPPHRDEGDVTRRRSTLALQPGSQRA